MMLPSLETCELNRSLDARSRAFSFSSCSIRDDSNMRRSRSNTARSSASCSSFGRHLGSLTVLQRNTRTPRRQDRRRSTSVQSGSPHFSAPSLAAEPAVRCHAPDTHNVTVFEVTLAISATGRRCTPDAHPLLGPQRGTRGRSTSEIIVHDRTQSAVDTTRTGPAGAIEPKSYTLGNLAEDHQRTSTQRVTWP